MTEISACLIEEQFSALLFAEVHALDGYAMSGGQLDSSHDDAGRPLADLGEVGQVGARIPRRHDHLQRSAELQFNHYSD